MRNFLMDCMRDLRSGTLPLKTGKEIHLTAHRVAMDKHADCRMEEIGIRDDEIKAGLKAMREVEP